MRLGVVITRAAAVRPTHTTVLLLVAALRAHVRVRVVEAADFELDERGRVQLHAFVLDEVEPSAEAVALALGSRSLPRRTIDASGLDVLLLRINPMDTAVLTFAQVLAARGVTVLNDPVGLLRTTHKSWLATLPSDVPRPRTLLTRSPSAATAFASRAAAGVVLKPARACGGRGVGRASGASDTAGLGAAFGQAAQVGDGYVIVQDYLPAAAEGEKRLLWLDGELLGGYLRRRPPGDFRHNLKVGATPEACDVSASDLAAVAMLSPHLRHERIWFAGVDLIGGKVVEVNVLNPGGAHFTQALGGVPVASRLVESLLARTTPVGEASSPPRLSVV